ncbi:DUF2391 family protein [Phenylobacterium sp. LjRoot225]|uniref:DUF2391 family protein n=1 Tax=Phenylobacterium sp. LjRoot225 TaxID=3342285 RepID=UPI003ED15F7C
MSVDAANEESYGRGLARAVAGALIFSFPLLMTMEMWQLGFYMDRLRLASLRRGHGLGRVRAEPVHRFPRRDLLLR